MFEIILRALNKKKNAQFLKDCISENTTCRDNICISKSHKVFLFEIRYCPICPAGRKKRVAIDVIFIENLKISQSYGVD